MDYILNIIVIISYISLVRIWWIRAVEGVWAPSTFFGYYTIIFGMPVYLLSMENGLYVAELFSESPRMTAILLAFGAYPAAMIAICLEQFTGNSKFFRLRGRMPSLSWAQSLKILAIVTLVLAIWVFLTPRFNMLVSLIRGLSMGESSELNYMRRVQFVDGFFNQKVFTWCRFSIGPVLALTTSEVLRGRIPSLFRWLVTFIIYFLFSAAFHKSTWVIGFAYIAINELFALRSKYAENSRLIALGILALSLFAGILVAFAYLLQYRSNETLSLSYHLIHGFTRLFGCINDGLLTFTYVFPNHVPYMPGPVLLGSISGETGGGPGRLSALALGVDTTIQPGMLGHLYSGLGVFCIPIYIFIINIICFVANLALKQNPSRLFQRVVGPCLGVAIMWTLHNPLMPAIFSSGLFLLIVGSFIYGLTTSSNRLS
ncbi:hypothetical protein ACFSSA_05395 [Luteolibacter algae]|uniref:Oligosaccharide repeat unit polymerase n=1 Tax=Luteolibacter algae TaxID=454151 RepID=A0ABW5D8Y2_9BACT